MTGSLSSGLTVRHSARLGRHVVAGRDIPVGAWLAVEEAAVWRLLPGPQLRRVCCHCLVESHSPLPCTKCAAVRYLTLLLHSFSPTLLRSYAPSLLRFFASSLLHSPLLHSSALPLLHSSTDVAPFSVSARCPVRRLPGSLTTGGSVPGASLTSTK